VFRRNVIALAILIDSGEVIFAITFAWMFLLTKYIVSVDLSSHPQMNVTHAKIAEAAVAGTSAFSMALLKSSFTLCARTGRLQVSVLVAYLRLRFLPFLVMFLIKALVMTLFDIVSDGKQAVDLGLLGEFYGFWRVG
jgi:hypothetical protein